MAGRRGGEVLQKENLGELSEEPVDLERPEDRVDVEHEGVGVGSVRTAVEVTDDAHFCSEALYLNKKLLVIPMKGQLEQKCNAYCLKQMGIPVIGGFGAKSMEKIQVWLNSSHYINLYYPHNNKSIVNKVFEDFLGYKQAVMGLEHKELLFSD